VKIYADSSFILRLIERETGSQEAINEYRRLGKPRLPFSPFHELEVRNAVLQRIFYEGHAVVRLDRRELLRQRDETLARLAQLLLRGSFRAVELDFPALIEKSVTIGILHTERLGCRAVDIFHVAAAEALQCEFFATIDCRQADLAKAVGLSVCAS
jgi:predicted nucleic acid-binding protein